MVFAVTLAILGWGWGFGAGAATAISEAIPNLIAVPFFSKDEERVILGKPYHPFPKGDHYEVVDERGFLAEVETTGERVPWQGCFDDCGDLFYAAVLTKARRDPGKLVYAFGPVTRRYPKARVVYPKPTRWATIFVRRKETWVERVRVDLNGDRRRFLSEHVEWCCVEDEHCFETRLRTGAAVMVTDRYQWASAIDRGCAP